MDLLNKRLINYVGIASCMIAGLSMPQTADAAALDIKWVNEGASGLSDPKKAVINQAIGYWEGLLSVPSARTFNLTVSEADLGTKLVGSASSFKFDKLGNPTATTVKFNTNKAVAPFYVDPTPNENSNFKLVGGIFKANAKSDPDGKWDLLTLINHEIGHALGFGGKGGVWNRFESRLGGTGNLTYLGENRLTFATTDKDHTSSNTDLLGDPGFQKSQRQFPNKTTELAALVDAFDYQGKVVVEKTGTSNAIKDNGTTTIELDVTEDFSISDLDIALYLKHTRVGDLELSLVSPDGTRVLLTDNRGGNGDNYGQASLWSRFDDEGRLFPVTTGAANFIGTFKPEGDLSKFDGKKLKGKWKLEIKDTTVGETGTFEGFTLIAATVPLPPAFWLFGSGMVILLGVAKRRKSAVSDVLI